MGIRIRMACAIAAMVMAAPVTVAQAGLLDTMFGPAARAAANTSEGRKKKVYGANTLTPGQLKNCILDANRIDNLNLELEGLVAPLDKERAELKAAQPPARGKPETDKGVIAYQARVKAFNERLDAIKPKIAAEKTLQDRFHTSCHDKGFFQSDLKAVLAEMPPAIINAVLRKK